MRIKMGLVYRVWAPALFLSSRLPPWLLCSLPLVLLLLAAVAAALLDLRGRPGDEQLAQIELQAVLLAAFSLL